MSTWKGISHGRTTRAMEQTLSPAEFKVVAVVRRLVPDGEKRRISQATIAAKAKVSEGTVSRTMRKVDSVFFRRHFAGNGRGNGYEIEAIPISEQLALPLAAPNKGSLTQDPLESRECPVPTPQTTDTKESLRDPCIFYDQTHEQQQQQTPAHANSGSASGQAEQLAPETVAALEKAGTNPKVIKRIAEGNPGCTPADVAAAVAGAHEKPNVHTPLGLALECLARGQRVITPRPVAAPETNAPERTRGRKAPPFDPAQARAFLAQHAAAPEPTPATDPPVRASPELAQRWQFTLGSLRENVTPGEYDAWFRLTRLVELADGEATVSAPAQAVDVLATRFARQIARALSEALGERVQVRIVAAGAAADWGAL